MDTLDFNPCGGYQAPAVSVFVAKAADIICESPSAGVDGYNSEDYPW